MEDNVIIVPNTLVKYNVTPHSAVMESFVLYIKRRLQNNIVTINSTLLTIN